MTFTVAPVPYRLLRYDRRNPRLPVPQLLSATEIAAALLAQSPVLQSETYLSAPDIATAAQLEPFLVVPESCGAYTVLDGNIRLARLQQQLEAEAPAVRTEHEPEIQCAIFTDRRAAWPYRFRKNRRGATAWRTHQWLEAVLETLSEGYTLAEIGHMFPGGRRRLARVMEAYYVLKHRNEQRRQRWSPRPGTSPYLLAEALQGDMVREAVGLPPEPDPECQPRPSAQRQGKLRP